MFVVMSRRRVSAASMGSSYRHLLVRSEWWRVLTAAVAHSGVLHLGFNVVSLWSCRWVGAKGRSSERASKRASVCGTAWFHTVQAKAKALGRPDYHDSPKLVSGVLEVVWSDPRHPRGDTCVHVLRGLEG